jgi:hypothetical protein
MRSMSARLERELLTVALGIYTAPEIRMEVRLSLIFSSVTLPFYAFKIQTGLLEVLIIIPEIESSAFNFRYRRFYISFPAY